MVFAETEGATRAWGPTQGGHEGEEEAKVSVARLMNANDGNDEGKAAHHPMDDTKTIRWTAAEGVAADGASQRTS